MKYGGDEKMRNELMEVNDVHDKTQMMIEDVNLQLLKMKDRANELLTDQINTISELKEMIEEDE